MSGGRFEYKEYIIEDIADTIEKYAQTSLQKAFAKHLHLAWKAVKDLDYEWSGDTGPGDADKAIRKVVSRQDELMEATEQAKEVMNELKKLLEDK